MTTQLGKYQLRRKLGAGGMGEVWEAHDTVLDRLVAVKLLSADAADARLSVREAAAAARVNHPNTVAVYDAAEFDGRWLIVMELVTGPSAYKLVDEHGPRPWAEATRIARDAAAGLAAVHAAGLVHRDVKPANILLTPDGTAKVADFGLARTSSRTTVTSVAGTPHYMSPEQCWNETADGRADVYSLGATYFTLLTGRPPFTGDTPMAVMYAHCHHPPPDPRAVTPDVPAGCAAVVRRAMAKAPAERFTSADELRAALDSLLAGTTNPVEGDRAKSLRLPPTTVVLPPARKPFPTRRVALTAGVGALAAVALTSFACWPRPTVPPPSADEPEWSGPWRLGPDGTGDEIAGVRQIAISPDGRRIAVTVNHQFRTGDKGVSGKLQLLTRDGKTLPGWPKAVGAAEGAAWTPDGRAVAVAFRPEGVVRGYSAVDGEVMPLEREELPEVFDVQFSDDGVRMAAAGYSGQTAVVRFWKWDAGRGWVARPDDCTTPASWCWGLRFVPGRTVVALTTGVGPVGPVGQINQAAVHLFDAATGGEVNWSREQLSWENHRPTVAFAASAPLMAVSSFGKVSLFRVPDWEPVGNPLAVELDRMKKDLGVLAVSPDGKWVAGAQDVNIHLWPTDDGARKCQRGNRQVEIGDGHSLTIHTLAFTPDGKRLLSGGEDGKVIIHDHADLFRRLPEAPRD
jgi:serine/threonine protein kinase/WD40 repeat protein